MARKPKPPIPEPDNPEQFKRFIDIAREIGTAADPDTFDRVLDKVARSPRSDHREIKEKVPPDRIVASRKRRKG